MYVVKSGSMEPKIQTGSVVLNSQKNSYMVGDVITFKVLDSKELVTHRINEIKVDAESNIFYIVKGDANSNPDPELVSKTNVVGSVDFSVPYLGYLIAFIKTIPGLIVFIIIPATIIVYEEIGKIKGEVKRIQEKKKKLVKKVKKEEKKIEKWYTKHTNKIKRWKEKNRQDATKKKEALDEKNN
jgi:signal peptidase